MDMIDKFGVWGRSVDFQWKEDPDHAALVCDQAFNISHEPEEPNERLLRFIRQFSRRSWKRRLATLNQSLIYAVKLEADDRRNFADVLALIGERMTESQKNVH